MLKKLVDEGLIRASPGLKNRSFETSQHIYEITPEGTKCLKEGRRMFANAGQRWSSMRRIFAEFVSPEQASGFLLEVSKLNFQMSQELIDTKISALSESDAEYVLKEYALNLERQLNWTKIKLSEFEKKRPTAVSTIRQTR